MKEKIGVQPMKSKRQGHSLVSVFFWMKKNEKEYWLSKWSFNVLGNLLEILIKLNPF